MRAEYICPANKRSGCTLLIDQKGQSLVQVLVSIGVMGAMLLSFTDIMSAQVKETRALSQKLAVTDLERLLQNSLADGSVCKYILNMPNALTFDSQKVSETTPQTIKPTLPIYASIKIGPPVVTGPIIAKPGEPASPNAPSVVIKDIVLSINGAPSPLPAPGPGVKFKANWEITLDPNGLVRPLRPITISTLLVADTSNPTAARITKCQDVVSNPVAAWVNFDATGNIRSSSNVSRVTHNKTGDYTIFFDPPMPDGNYAASILATSTLGDATGDGRLVARRVSGDANSFRFVLLGVWVTQFYDAQSVEVIIAR